MATDAGLSKKELNKLARKEGRKAGGTEVAVNTAATLLISFSKGFSPDLSRAVELHLAASNLVQYTISKGEPHLPILTNVNGLVSSISGDANIARFIVRSNPSANDFYGNNDPWLMSQIDQWVDVYTFASNTNAVAATLSTMLETHLSDKTYMAGHTFTLADMAVALTLRRFTTVNTTTPNISRWLQLVSDKVPQTGSIPLTFNAKPAGAAVAASKVSDETAAVAKTTGAAAAATAESTERDDSTGSCPPLEGAIDGQVVTRFPPEPSGYLHIGTCCAPLPILQ
jgi:glutamyl-tRNA synthetase